MNEIREIELKRLNQELEKLEKDYKDVADKSRRESNPQEQNNLELQLQQILKQMEVKQQKINQLKEKEENEQRDKLINILKNSFDEERDNILYAYQASLPNRLINIIIPQNGEEVISALLLPQQQKGYSYVHKFVGYLLLSQKVSGQFKQGLKTWAEKNIDNCNQLIQQLTQEQRQQEQKYNPCLMIAISKFVNNYVVEAWLIKNLDQYNSREFFSDCEQLKIENKSEIFTDKNLINLPRITIDLIQQGSIKANKSIKQIHLFLPSELINHDFDSWKTEEDEESEKGQEDLSTGICEEYEVVIRCSDRLRGKSPPVFKWREKANILNSKLEEYANSVFVLGSSDNQKTLFNQVKQLKVIAVKITSLFERGELLGNILFKSGVPLALWTRQQIPDIEQEFSKILKNENNNHEDNNIYLKELPSQFKSKKAQCNNNINHLCLLWDDPNLLPPEQLLTENKL